MTEKLRLNPDSDILRRDFLKPVQFMSQDGREFVHRISVMQLTVPDSAHRQEDFLVIGVSETETAGPDPVFAEPPAGQLFHGVRLDDALVQMPIGQDQNLLVAIWADLE